MKARVCGGMAGLVLALLGAMPASGQELAAELPAAPDPASFAAAPADQSSAATPWGIRLQGGAEYLDVRHENPGGAGWRAAVDMRHEFMLDDAWRFTLSDRLEWARAPDGGSAGSNALREAYVTARLGDTTYLDLGRVNQRSGVALGYNPTDWLRGNLLSTPSNQNPATARENRLGAVMLRLQHVGEWGSAQLAYAPRLTEPSLAPMDAWGLNLDRGNDTHTVQVRVSPRVSERFSLELLALQRERAPVELGFNASAVLTPSVLAHMEASWARRTPLRHWAQSGQESGAWRVATGLNWTLSHGSTLGLEYHHAGDALDRTDWNRLRSDQGVLAARQLTLLRGQRARTQDPLVRDSWFARWQWNDVLRDGRFDLGAYARYNPYDRSHQLQLSGAWHLQPDLTMRLIGLRNSGSRTSEHGAKAQRSYVWLGLEHWF